MHSPDKILSIDVGTQSLRALVFDRDGRLLNKVQLHYPPYQQPQPGYCVHDAQMFWQSLQNACQQLWQQGTDSADIAAMSVTTQRGSLVPLDIEHQPLSPLCLWMDQRKADGLPPMPWWWRWAFTLRGVRSAVTGFRRNAFSNWLALNHPETSKKVASWVFLSGYLHLCLTAKRVDSVASQVGYIPFDFRQQRWAHKWSWKWSALTMRPEQMPDLVAPGDLIGAITDKASELTGIPAGVPVVASGADKACEVIGSGGQGSDVASLSFGTSASVNVCGDQYRESVAHMPAYPSVIPGQFCYEVMLNRGFWMVSWFKQQFGLEEVLKAEETDGHVEALFDALVDKVPPGSMGLMLQPYWGAGIREPGPEAKGAIIGFGDIHKREHIYRAILEGISFGLKEGLQKIEKRSRRKINRLYISGGGSQSDAAMQIAADIFGLPAHRPHTNETSGLGAAMACATHLNWYPSMRDAVEKMSHVDAVFQPNPVNQQVYQRLYREVYQQMYPKLQPLYRTIRDITGYPD